MKPLLCILSYAKANDMVARHWPWFEKAGADILFVGREDSDCRAPTGPENRSMIGTVKIGKDSYVSGDNLPRLFIDTLSHVLTTYRHEDILLAEPDTIFVKPVPPRPHIGLYGFSGCLAGGESKGFFAPYYFHPVWRVTRDTAALMVEYGERMLRCGMFELGFPDRWIGLMVHLYAIEWHPFPEFSVQAIDNPDKVKLARNVIASGYACAVHGIKTAEQLRAVTEGLVTP
jgi:hypothetical protein